MPTSTQDRLLLVAVINLCNLRRIDSPSYMGNKHVEQLHQWGRVADLISAVLLIDKTKTIAQRFSEYEEMYTQAIEESNFRQNWVDAKANADAAKIQYEQAVAAGNLSGSYSFQEFYDSLIGKSNGDIYVVHPNIKAFYLEREQLRIALKNQGMIP